MPPKLVHGPLVRSSQVRGPAVRNSLVGESLVDPLANRNRSEALAKLAITVQERFGLRSGGDLHDKLERAFEASGATNVEAWASELRLRRPGDPAWLEVVERLTVHETYFFRDEAQLEFLEREVIVPLLRERRDQGRLSLRLWSAGCSTGEEAYSLAMLVLDALRYIGHAWSRPDGSIDADPRWRLEILGTDVSREALRKARSACYAASGHGSIRQPIGSRWDALFEPAPSPFGAEDEGVLWHRPRECVRRLVSFRQHNLLDADPPLEGVDVVACRNVFIYFEAAQQRQAQAMLARALGRGGSLFLGTTDRLGCDELFDTRYQDEFVLYSRREVSP